jgi:hypothetical protein
VSEEHVTPTFRVEEYAKQTPAQSRALLAAFFMLVSWFAYSSTAKIEVTCSSKTMADLMDYMALYARRQNSS